MKQLLLRYGIYLLLAPVVALLILFQPVFFSPGNLITLITQSSIIGIVSTGMTFIILTGGIDLSVGSILYISGVAAVLTMRASEMVWLAVVAALLAGGVCGTINGFSVAKLGLPPMIATLATTSIARGLGHIIVNGRAILNMPERYTQIGQGKLLAWVPIPVLLYAVVFVLAWFVLNKKPFGHFIYAIGNNRDAADASGIQTPRVLFCIYLATGLLCGIGGVVLTSRLGGSQVDLGQGLDFSCITAVALGGTSLYGGKGRLGGTLAGVFIVGAIENLLRLLNVSVYFYDIVWGIVIFLAVLIDQSGKKQAESLEALTEIERGATT
ncbi:MAG: ABC transporter permease [Anaerotruncus sp.]|nr:ABC transporter permease [Anaerotruncus sp.]